MATIVLDYNARNSFAQRTLEYILSLGLFQSRSVAYAPVIEEKSTKRKKLDKELNKYLIDLSSFKFNRDEANNYD